MEKYKIAIMGATGVGKTVFLGSYFNMVFNVAVEGGQQRRPISVKQQKSVDRIAEIIATLFERRKAVQGTAERTDFSFCVDSLNMDVTLFDVPGGYTQDMDRWIETEIAPDLRTANGVLFFLSGEDLIHHPEKLLKDNMVFARAISLVRENQGRKWEGRQDVPITFIFTKGDTIPDVDVKTLQAKIAPLFQAACQDREDAGLLLKRLFKKGLFQKGKHVQCFKTTALGKWPDPQTPPRDYQPENVVEPMEKLYEAMRKTKTEYRYKRLKVAASIAALCFLVFLGGCWSFDFWRWNRALKEYERSLERREYPSALAVLDEFADRYVFPEPLPLYPDFLRPGRGTRRLRETVYVKYEEDLFARIEPFLKDAELFLSEEASTDIVPFPVDTADRARTFLDAAKQARTYLGCQEFRESQPERYERVLNAKGFFADAGAVALVMVQAEAIMVQAKAIVEGKAVPEMEGAAGGDLFASAMDCLKSLKVLGPRLASEDIQLIDRGLRTVLSAWCPSLAPDPTLDELDTWFARSMEMLALASPSPLSEENRKVVTDAELRWQNLWEKLWANRVDEQLKKVEEWPEVEKKNVLMGLLSRGRMPDPSRFRLVNAVADVDMKLYSKDAYGLEKARLAGRDRGMSEGKDEAFKRLIRDLNQEALNKAVEFFGDVQTVEGLDEALSNARSLPNFPDKGTEVARYFQLAVERVVKNECEELNRNDDFRDHLEAHRFDEAYGLLEELNRSLKGLVPLIASVRECTEAEAGRDLRKEVYAFFSDGEDSLLERHYKFCRETAQVEMLYDWKKLDEALLVLDAFLSSWTFEAENGTEKSEALKKANERYSEVRSVREFLENLKSGKEIPGTLTVVSAEIEKLFFGWDRWALPGFKDPDVEVVISHGGRTFSTPCINDNYEPYFGYSEKICLRPRETVYIKVLDVDDGDSELIFEVEIHLDSPKSCFGISGKYYREGSNTLTLRFTPDTPYPW